MVLTHSTSWYHWSKYTSVFPGVASPLKVFILGYPASVQLWACWGGRNLHWPMEDCWATAWAWQFTIPSPLQGPHPHGPCWLHCCPHGSMCWPRVTCAGVLHPPSWPSWSKWPPTLPTAGLYQVPRYPWLRSPGAYCLGWVCWGRLEFHPINWGLHGRTCGVTASCGYLIPYLFGTQGSDTEHNGIVMPNHGCC